MTPKQAAERFAQEFDEPRSVGTILVNPYRFQLVDGVRWYQVNMLNDYSGYEVLTEGATSDASRPIY